MTGDRDFDVALFGATGFTGGLTARYLAANAPASLRWALVGRNRGKLEAVRAALELGSQASAPDLIEADAADAAALQRVAGASRVVLSTVGPYMRYGEPLVAACAAAGTDYADLTGESEFVDRMWLGYHEQAQRSGARLVHCCGFDSIPHDLGAYFTVKQLPEGVPLTVNGYVSSNGNYSGGTYHTAIEGLTRGRQILAAARERGRREQRRAGRRIRSAPVRLHHLPELGGWSAPLPTIDGSIVRRSAAALERYGPDFAYGHNLLARHLVTIPALAAGVGTVGLLAQLPPARRLMLKAKPVGQGPGEAVRAKTWFRISFVGEGGGRRLVTEVSGGDPGYGETSKMLAEAGLCLAFDDLPQTAGQVTTAAAMGDALLDRLQRAGISFRLVQTD